MVLDESVLEKTVSELSKGIDISQKPLPEELYEFVRNYTKQYTVLGGREGALGFFEDQLTHTSMNISHAIFGQDIHKEVTSKYLPTTVLLNKFFIVALCSYLNKTTGAPEHVQRLPNYDASKGNQVDLYLKEFFGIE